MKQNQSTRFFLPATAVVTALAAGIAFAQTMPAKEPKAPTAPAAAPATPAAPTSSQSSDALFKRIDTDADGSLSKAELEKFDPEAAKSFDKYDADKDSKLSLSEFDTMVKGLRAG
ncbi:MAG: hypothetical protein ACRDAM_01515 [Casimicrobium sp.]